MAWIESHTVLSRHRKLAEFAGALRVRRSYAMGHLHALWHAALEQQEDGDLSSWSDEFIATSSDYPGDAPQYVRLLQQHHWLDGRLLHDWVDYAGLFLIKKYSTSNREWLVETWRKHGREYGANGKRTVSEPQASLPNLTVPNLTQPKKEGGAVGDLRARAAQVAPASPTRPIPGGEGVQAGPAAPAPAQEDPTGEDWLGVTNKPTTTQALAHHGKHWATCEAAYTVEELRDAYRQMEAGKDLQGFWMWGKHRAGDWRAALEQRMADNRKKQTQVSPTAQAILDSQELPRVEKKIAEILNKYEGHQTMEEQDKKAVKDLRQRREVLKARLGFAV